MRIAHVVTGGAVIGGAERMLLAIVRHCDELGWPQLVAAPFAPTSTGTPLHEELGPVGYIGLPCRSARDVPALRRALTEHLRDFEPDIIHAHLFHASVLLASLRRMGEVRILSHQHGRLLFSRRRFGEAALDWAAGYRYDRVVACSESVRRFLVHTYRYRASRVVTIHNGWEGTPPSSSGGAAVPTAICVANLRPEKGHTVLLEAWREVVDAMPAAELLLVGDGPLAGDLQTRVRAEDLDTNVRFTGQVADVWAHLAGAHVFVLPSLHEPFGIVAVEAMAAGLPVVASDVGGLPEFVQPGHTGVLVPPGDASALAAALLDLLGSAEHRARLEPACRARAAELTVERAVTRYERLYEELAVP